MEPKKKKNTSKDESSTEDIEKERQELEVPDEDLDMLREKNDSVGDSQYDDDNSFGDDR